MKRLFLLFFIPTLFFIGCKKIGGLSVVSVNNNKPLIADVIKIVRVGEEEEEVIMEYTVPVEFVYTYAGYGLPTNNPYTAQLTEYKIEYFQYDEKGKKKKFGETGEVIKGECQVEIPADIEGKNTVVAHFKVNPSWWTDKYLGDLIEGIQLVAYFTFTGKEKLTGEEVSCEAKLTINFADYYPD
ncbi:MAG: hypothetical protein ABIK99_07590 [candidate division WOR-3 bacterium]